MLALQNGIYKNVVISCVDSVLLNSYPLNSIYLNNPLYRDNVFI